MPRAWLVFSVLFLATWLTPGASARAEEVITRFDSAITVERSGLLDVSETITVNAEGNRIKRGIYRDFPLVFEGDDGRIHRVDFDITEIKRDGAAEKYRTESIEDGIRIYIGDPDVYLDPGEHSYEIRYETDRQIRYFDRHDELFWNVTGNGWQFPILSAHATVTLPESATIEKTVFYTGPIGATDRNARSSKTKNTADFTTTKTLLAGEGLTIGVKIAKGVIDPPNRSDTFWWALKDWWNAMLAGFGLVVVGSYFVWNWIRIGRDPAAGVVVPRWDAPEGLSPALVNFVARRGFSGGGWTAFSAAILNLAVNGYVELDDVGDSVTIKRGDRDAHGLPPGEKAVYMGLGGAGEALPVSKAYGPKLKRLGDSFRSAIEKEHSGKYHRYNFGVIAGGIVLTVAFYVSSLVFGTYNDDLLGLMVVPAVMFVFTGVFSAILAPNALSANSAIFRYGALLMLGVLWFCILLVIAVSGFAVAEAARTPADLIAWFCASGMIVVAVVFSTIMGAATPLGRKLRDGIDGLALYLRLAEQDRMNMAGAPAMSPRHFETLLPYAVALGLEKPWSNAFQSWLDKAGTMEAENYQPLWYHGRFDHNRFGRQMAGFSSSLSSTIASSLPPPPKSSSSGFSSGGSSGGGGGGGGGGGW